MQPKVPSMRKRIVIDNLTVTPVDKNVDGHILVAVYHFSKRVRGMPASRMDEVTSATAILVYVSMFGLFEEIWSDTGSDFKSNVVNQFNINFGIKHVVSIVDRHTSCGVDGPNKQILRHLMALVQDDYAESRWSDPVFYMFGSEDGSHLRLPDTFCPLRSIKPL